MRASGALRIDGRQAVVKMNGPTHVNLKRDLERVEANGMLLCQCSQCEMIVLLAETNSGLPPLYCPHCHKVTLKRWGTVDITFKPEKPLVAKKE